MRHIPGSERGYAAAIKRCRGDEEHLVKQSLPLEEICGILLTEIEPIRTWLLLRQDNLSQGSLTLFLFSHAIFHDCSFSYFTGTLNFMEVCLFLCS